MPAAHMPPVPLAPFALGLPPVHSHSCTYTRLRYTECFGSGTSSTANARLRSALREMGSIDREPFASGVIKRATWSANPALVSDMRVTES